MEIIDAQIHEPQVDRPWEFGEESRRALAVELAREAMDSVGVDRALVNASDEYCALAVARYPGRFAICSTVDHADPNLAARLSSYRERPGRLAVRTWIVNWDDGSLRPEFERGDFEPLFAAAERERVPLFVMASGRAERLASVAEAHPGLTLIIDHLGLPQPTMRFVGDPWERLSGVNQLARYPQVALKMSSAVTLSRERYPHNDLWPHLHSVIEAFGPGRLMWGSDFTRLRTAPPSKRRAPRRRWLGLYSDSVSFLRDTSELSDHDKAEIFSGTIRRILRWKEVP